MANYEVTEATISQTPVFCSFIDILRADLSKEEVLDILQKLTPYLDPDCFNEDNSTIEFEYYPSDMVDEGDDSYRFLITKKD